MTAAHVSSDSHLLLYIMTTFFISRVHVHIRAMASRSGRGRGGRRGRGRGGQGVSEPITWPGSFCPSYYLPPPPELPLEQKSDFTHPHGQLRHYDDREEEWPKCVHGDDVVVQMYDGGCDSGRRFFRCPRAQVKTSEMYISQLTLSL